MKYRILILLSTLLSNLAYSQDISIDIKLQEHFINLTHIECKYKQEKKLSMLNEPLISTGIFKYKKGGIISWEQQTPFKEIYLINNGTDNKFDKYINQFIISILTGKILNDKKLEVTYSEDVKNYFVLLIPKKGVMKKNIKDILLTFNKEIITLSQLEIVSENGDVNKINFFDN
jgi:hypothetical protein